MDFYILFILILIIPFLKINIKKININYADKYDTSVIKGIFILIVFLSHSMSYIDTNINYSFLSKGLVIFLSQLMVCMFLFYSGYGVLESIKKKGNEYIDNMPKKRILKTLINFDIVVLIYAVLFFIINGYLSKKQLLFSLVGWDSFGNSNWYIFDILILYTITFLSFSIFDKDNKKGVLLTTLLSLVFIAFIYGYKDSYWYNTVLAYPFGMCFSLYKEKLDSYYLTSNKKFYLTLLISLLTFFIIKKYEFSYPMSYLLLSIIFCFIIVLISMKLEIRSFILKWFGENLFWVYILQRIPMIVLKNYYPNIKYYYFMLISFIATIIMCIFRNFIIKVIKNKK